MPNLIGTYNICNGRKEALEAAHRGMSQANMDLGILQETKLTDGIYTRGSASYSVIVTDAPSRHRGGVKVARHQQFRAPWLPLDRLQYSLHRRRVIGIDVHTCDVPPLLPRRKLEPNYIGSKLLHRLHQEVWFGVVEECDAATVSAWCIRRDDAIAGHFAGVDTICEFCLLEDSQIRVSLGHPPECCLQTFPASVANVVGAESNRHLQH